MENTDAQKGLLLNSHVHFFQCWIQAGFVNLESDFQEALSHPPFFFYL